MCPGSLLEVWNAVPKWPLNTFVLTSHICAALASRAIDISELYLLFRVDLESQGRLPDYIRRNSHRPWSAYWRRMI